MYGIPHHVRLDAVFDNPVGNRFVNVRGASVACGATPPAYPDPALPIYPPNCAVEADAAVGSVEFAAQNFAPEDTAAMSAVTEFIAEPLPCPDRLGLELGYRQDLRSATGGLWRASGCAQRVTSAGVEMPRNQTYEPRITPWITREELSDISASVGAVIRNGEGRLLVELAGSVPSAPADMHMSFQSTASTAYVPVGSRIEIQSRNIFDLVVPPGLDVDIKR